MNGVLFTLPDGLNGDTLPGWLDWHLVTPGLEQLVAELAAVHGTPGRPTSLESLLAGHRAQVLAAGLGELPPELLPRLLRQPELLLELRDLVFAEGGAYWDRLDPEEFPQERIEAIVDMVRAGKGREQTTVARPQKSGAGRTLFAMFATAAAVLVAVYALGGLNRPPVGGGGGGPTGVAKAGGINWGWASKDGIPTKGTDAESLRHLRAKANEWGKDVPQTRTELAQRIGEFRIGCAALQTAEQLALSQAEKDELLKRCTKWAADFDGLMRRAENPAESVAAVRKDTDELVGRLSKYLEDREKAASKA